MDHIDTVVFHSLT